ncbi:MAG: glycoside hydrolase family protein [Campylobacterales bacterium]|nr:glycoside hydrolase family protein [Campylobacterales bacterium]
MKALLEEIKINEGFRGSVYKDTEGFDTIGYGTKLPINENEAALLAEHRLKSKIKEIEKREPFINSLSEDKQAVIIEMCYQMGVSGVLKFAKMWAALKAGDTAEAAAQMLDSRWAMQTPNRARLLADKMRR